MQGLCFINHEWVKLHEASLPLADLGIVRGYGAFDYLRTYQGVPFHTIDHLVRFKRSANILGLQLPFTFEEIEILIAEILNKTQFNETSLKLILTGGPSSDQFTLEGLPTFCLMAFPHKNFPLKQYVEGIAVCTTSHLRALPHAKSTCYLTAIHAMQQAKTQGATDALYVNPQGEVLEALTSNVFVCRQGKLITPISHEILPGITREIVRRCAYPDIEVEIAPLPLNEQETWEEMFITSSSREVMPVTSIDGKPVGQGKVGPLAVEMLRRFRRYVESHNWASLESPYQIINSHNL